ncbi:spermatogenesis-associated protein 31E1-like [Marmota flaviventris]|uniref:spermatogenesis-associated protein 31E1-like n=1 Tax=Marmota flaviventris TaxID=93162 RepID=UPI003A87ED44
MFKQRSASKQIEKRCRKKSKKKRSILKACRDCRKKVEETQQLALILQSHLRKFHENITFLQLLHEDAPGEVFKPGPAGANQPPLQNVEHSSSTSMSLLTSLLPLTKHPLPLASSLSDEARDHQPGLNRVPLGPIPQGSLSGSSYWASLVTAISGLDCISYCILFFSWWWTTTKALFFSTWTHARSQKDIHLSHHPRDSTLWGDPTHQQVEVGGLSFINPDVQKLLEMLISKRAELKVWKENTKDGSSFKPMSPDHCLHSLGKMLKSLGGKRDTTAHPFCSTKGKPEQLPDSHMSLTTSESLVATAQVPKRSSAARCKDVTFNKVSDSSPVPSLAEVPPQLSQDQPLPSYVAQSQFLTQTLPPSEAQAQNHTHLTSFPPNLPPSSPPQKRTQRTICPTSQEEVWPFSPAENQHVERHLQKQHKQKEDLPSSLQKSQEANSQSALNHCQHSHPSLTPKSTSILPRDSNSTKLQERPEKHSLGRFTTDAHQHGPPCRLQASQDLTQPRGKFPRKCSGCQAKDKHGPFLAARPPELACESSKGVQKVRSRCSERFLKGPEQDLERHPQDLPWNSRGTSVKVLENEKEDSGSKKLLEKILQDHLSSKLVQINEGIIPVYVRGSWLASNYTFPKYSTNKNSINLASSKDQLSRVNTSQNLSFLDPGTHLMLETDIMRSRVRHRWSPHLQTLDPLSQDFDEKPASPVPQPDLPLVPCDSADDSTAQAARFPEGLPWKGPGEKAMKKKAVPTLQSPLPEPSPAEMQKAWRGTPLGGSHEPSVVPPATQGDPLPSQPHTYSLSGRTQPSRIITGMARGSLEPSPGLREARYEPWEESGVVASGMAMPEGKEESQSSRSEETRKTEVEKEEPPEREVPPLPARETSDPPESCTERRKNHVSQSLHPNKKGRGQEDSLQKVKPLPATTKIQRSVSSRVPMDDETAEAQNIVTAVGQILVDKLAHQHAGSPPELH